MTRSTKSVTGLRLSLGVVLLAVLSGCQTPPRVNPVEALMKHPELEDAMMCAPDFTTAALKTIADQHAALRGR